MHGNSSTFPKPVKNICVRSNKEMNLHI